MLSVFIRIFKAGDTDNFVERGNFHAYAKGYSEFTIGVEDDNETAVHIYSKLGFTQLVGKISEEYQGDSYEYGLYLRA